MGHCGYTEPPDTEWRHSAVGGARKPGQGLPVLSVAFHRSSSVGRPSSNWSSSETITASTKLSCWFHCTPHPSQYWVHWQHILGSRTKTHWARDWKPTLKGLLPSRRAALRVAISQLIQSQVLHYIYLGKFCDFTHGSITNCDYLYLFCFHSGNSYSPSDPALLIEVV